MAIYRRPGTSVLYCKFEFKTRQYFRSTGTSNMRDAEAFERRLRTELEDAHNPAAKTNSPPIDLLRQLDQGRAAGEQKVKSYTHGSLATYWGHLALFFENTQAVNAQSLRAYVKHRAQSKIKSQTIKKELTVLKRGLRLAKADGYPVDIPDTWPKLAKEEPNHAQEGHLISRTTLLAWLGLLRGQARDMALLALLTGLRKGELYRLDPAWIEPTGISRLPAMLRLPAWATKGRRQRDVGLVPEALVIARFAPFHSEHKTAYENASKTLGGRSIHLRDMRHTFSTIAAQKSKDALGVAMVMGHAADLMTLRYQSMDPQRAAKIHVPVWRWYDKP